MYHGAVAGPAEGHCCIFKKFNCCDNARDAIKGQKVVPPCSAPHNNF